ncbi:MAG: hypothetical protein QOI00_2333, partial [Chloroflexota bacterium]|nr:hypothetical protein [Chloroflexota bacterium]
MRRQVISIVTVAVLAALFPVATPAMASTGSSLYLSGQPGEWLTQGQVWAYDPDPTLTAAGTSNSIVVTNADWRLELRAPVGQAFATGTFVVPSGQSQGDGPWVDLSGFHRGCGWREGRFVVIEPPILDGAGQVTSMAVDFQIRCGNALVAMDGSVRINSSADVEIASVTVPPPFAPTIVGQNSQSAAILVSNPGPASITLGPASPEGVDPNDFEVVSNGCASLTLAHGGSCTVRERFTPTATWKRAGSIRIATGTPIASFAVPVAGIGISPITLVPSAIAVDSEPGDPIGLGADTTSQGATVWAQGAANQIQLGTTGWSLIFRSAEGSNLDPGLWQPAASFGGGPPDMPRFSIDSAFGCGYSTGWFRIYEPPLIDVDGSVLRFSADFGQTCDGYTGGLRGSIRFHSSVPLPSSIGSVAIEGGAPATSTADVSILMPTIATDNVAISNDGSTWTERPYAPAEHWTLAGGDGARTVWAKWTTGTAAWSEPVSDSIVLDTVAPTASAPVRALARGTALTSGLIPIRLTWTGADATSGIVRYELSQSTDGGSYGAVSTTLASGRSDRLLAPGHTYRFRVRAVDNAGNVGIWAYGSSLKLFGVPQSSSAVHYFGSWATVSSTTWWGGTARRSSSAGATARYTFTGRSIALVGLMASNRGKAQVYVNGVLKATIDLYSATTLKQRIVWSANYSTSATRTVTIKVLGT